MLSGFCICWMSSVSARESISGLRVGVWSVVWSAAHLLVKMRNPKPWTLNHIQQVFWGRPLHLL